MQTSQARRRSRLALAALVFGLDAGCMSLSGLGGGGEGPEAGADGAIDASQVQEAEVEESGDEAPPPDAGADVVDAADSAFCAQHVAALCIDFDEGSLANAFHNGLPVAIASPIVQPAAAGDASLTASPRSSPSAFAAAVAPIADASAARVRYAQPLNVDGVRSAQLQFDMRLLTYTTGQEVDFSALFMTPSDGGAPTRSYFSVSASGMGQLDIEPANAPSVSKAFLIPSDGAWHTYLVELSFTPGGAIATVYVDPSDSDGGPSVLVTTPAPHDPMNSASFELGASVYGPSQAVVVDLDNVVFTTQ